MKTAVDLHMHSALSPCGDEAMTPNNIVGMACIKELDLIALTDHNTAKNVPAVMKAAKEYGIAVLPGIEVTTKEEAHVLAYFENLDGALALDEILYDRLPDIPNRPDYFGRQLILDEEDEIIGEVTDKLLVSATDISVNELLKIVNGLGGIIMPAHVDRKSYSLIVSLGFIPPDLPVDTLELSKMCTEEQAKKQFRFFKKYQFLHGSDAHYLEDIAERAYFLDLPDLRRGSVLDALSPTQKDLRKTL